MWENSKKNSSIWPTPQIIAIIPSRDGTQASIFKKNSQHATDLENSVLDQWFSVCGLCISSISITWTLVRNAHFHILLHIYWIRNSGVGIQPSVVIKKNNSPADYDLHNHFFVVSLPSCVWLFETPWTVACQALLSVGFPRQECWNGLPFPSPGDLPNPGMEPMSPALTSRFIYFFTAESPGKPTFVTTILYLM